MIKSKKLNISMMAVVVMAVLLTVAITTVSTLAWFSSQDGAAKDFTLGEPVIIQAAEYNKTAGTYTALADDVANISVIGDATKLLPGMAIAPNLAAIITQSNTRALVRAKFELAVTDGESNAVMVELVDATSITLNKFLLAEMNRQLEGGDRHTLAPVDTAGVISYVATLAGQYGRKIADGWALFDGWWYYKGVTTDNVLTITKTGDKFVFDYGTAVDTALKVNNTIADGDEATDLLASVDASGADKGLDFLTTAFTLPTFLTNEFANAKIEFKITYQAVQDYLIDVATYDGSAQDRVDNTVEYAIAVFKEAFGA